MVRTGRLARAVATGIFAIVALGAISAAVFADDAVQVSDSSSAAADHGTRLIWRPYRPEHPAKRVIADGGVRQASNEEPIDDSSGTPRITSRRLETDMDVAQAPAKSNNSLFDPFADKTNPTNPTAPPAKANPFPDDPASPALPATPGQPVAPSQLAPPATLPAPIAPAVPAVQPGPSGVAPPPDGDNLKFRQSPVPPSDIAPAPNTQDQGCGPNQESCDKELEALYKNTIDKVSLDITEHGKPGDTFPCECGLGNVKFVPRQWDCITYTWKASALCHKPLYFEEVGLERYNHSRGPILDPLVSAAHFFVCVPLLPYEMGVALPDECQYALGYYRPGSCAPWIIDGFPLSCRGAVFEATAWTGTGFLLP